MTRPEGAGPPAERVIVVTGLPRSGTSMLMQMLVAGGVPAFDDAQRPADEDNPRGYYEHAAVRRILTDASWMAGAVSRAVKVVVPLVNRLPAGFRYSVVLVRRDLNEVLASQAAMLRRLGRPAGDVSALRDVFARQLREAATALARRADVALLEVEYREMVGDPARAAAVLAEHVGAPLDTAKMAAAVIPALQHQRSGA